MTLGPLPHPRYLTWCAGHAASDQDRMRSGMVETIVLLHLSSTFIVSEASKFWQWPAATGPSLSSRALGQMMWEKLVRILPEEVQKWLQDVCLRYCVYRMDVVS